MATLADTIIEYVFLFNIYERKQHIAFFISAHQNLFSFSALIMPTLMYLWLFWDGQWLIEPNFPSLLWH